MSAILDEYASSAQFTGGLAPPCPADGITDIFARFFAIVREPAPGQKITIDDRASAIRANVIEGGTRRLWNIRFRMTAFQRWNRLD
jgi:hypothetical protein